MPYDAPGARVVRTASAELVHGQAVAADGAIGFAAKVSQLDRFVRPDSDEATHIQVDEEYVVFITGVHELPLAGGLAGSDVGDKLYVHGTTNAVTDSSGSGKLPLGVIDEIDTTRDPEVARVNLNAWQAFG